jgi:phosphopantothenoylcysteine decarboxylase/phosphopantothenate--cysteine ligase
MYDHSIIKQNITRLKDKDLNIDIMEPKFSENKYKMPTNSEIVSQVIRKLWKQDLLNKRVLIIGGATEEAIDDMRILTNRSSGKTGIALAEQAYMRGGDVTLWLGRANVESPAFIHCQRFLTVAELKEMVKCNIDGLGYSDKNDASLLKNEKNKNANIPYDIIIVCAAISDYTVLNKVNGKVPSGMNRFNLELAPTDKILELISKRAKQSYIVGYKAESKIPDKKLIDKAHLRLTELGLNLIVANDLENVSTESNKIIIIHPTKKYRKVKGTKDQLAQCIFDEIISYSK